MTHIRELTPGGKTRLHHRQIERHVVFMRADNLQESKLEVMQRALITGREIVQVGIDEAKHEAPIHEREASLHIAMIKIKKHDDAEVYMIHGRRTIGRNLIYLQKLRETFVQFVGLHRHLLVLGH